MFISFLKTTSWQKGGDAAGMKTFVKHYDKPTENVFLSFNVCPQWTWICYLHWSVEKQ